jgi:hypothetical protein
MAELSERFAELMARLAKSDAELFRTLGEQNASVRQLVDDLTVAAAPTADGSTESSQAPALAAQTLLPPAECTLAALKTRFRRIADAQAWAEERLGPAPKKPTWAVLEHTFRSGAWPVAASKRSASSTGQQAAQLEQRLLERLEQLEQRLTARLDGLEQLLRSRLTGP